MTELTLEEFVAQETEKLRQFAAYWGKREGSPGFPAQLGLGDWSAQLEFWKTK